MNARELMRASWSRLPASLEARLDSPMHNVLEFAEQQQKNRNKAPTDHYRNKERVIMLFVKFVASELDSHFA